MLCKTWVAALLTAALAAPAGAAVTGKHDFILVNQTGLAMDKLYVVPLQATAWEEDLLKRDLLLPGEEAKINFSRQDSQCRWDLVVVDSTGTEVTWEDVNLCKKKRVLLRLEEDVPEVHYE
ncbi:Argininosuccinate lyase [Desulfarculales bacterium]